MSTNTDQSITPIEPVAPPTASTPDPLTTLQSELERTRQTLATLTRERTIARELFALGALDLDISAAVLERDITAAPDTPIATLAANLKQRKPSLFRHPGGLESLRAPSAAPTATTSQRPRDPASPTEQAARTAAASNSRTALLHYMRLKRRPAA
jgi:hypothetical protein